MKASSRRASIHDVLIVGAGPAGASLALHLGRCGLRVGLIEAREFPRPKPCGEFIGPEALALLAELGVLDELLALGAPRLRGLEFHARGRAAVGRFLDLPGRVARPDCGMGVRREDLDDALLRAALATGAVDLLAPCRVVGLLRDAGGVVLGVGARHADGSLRQLRAGFTVGADGLHSRVARELGVRRRREGLDRIALVTRYTGARARPEALAEILPDGFLAAAPVGPDTWTVNVVLERRAYITSGRAPVEALESRLAESTVFRDLLASARRSGPVRGAGPLSWSTSAQVFDGAALVGDACGYVDPFTGDGIYLALRGAALLAPCLAGAVSAGRIDRDALQAYAQARRRAIAPRERAGLVLLRALRHPALVRAGLTLMSARPGLADVAVTLKGEPKPLSELLRPSLWRQALA